MKTRVTERVECPAQSGAGSNSLAGPEPAVDETCRGHSQAPADSLGVILRTVRSPPPPAGLGVAGIPVTLAGVGQIESG